MIAQHKIGPNEAVFTLSLDCEGFWGMADNRRIIGRQQITSMSNDAAYKIILNTLQQNGLRATAAFVTCYAAEIEAVRDKLPLILEIAEYCPSWFAQIIPALESGELDGWRGANLYRSMAAAGFEMAWHGATHLPLSEQTPAEAVILELELASQLFASLGHTPDTVAFPKNQVGHLEKLRSYGFTTYRAGYRDGQVQKLLRFLNEYDFLHREIMEKPVVQDGWRVFPAGHFLNWPAGVRALVPVSTTVKRWKTLLRSAADQGGYVHMWFHPHNLITSPSMRYAFEEIMSFAGELVSTGHLVNRTMGEV